MLLIARLRALVLPCFLILLYQAPDSVLERKCTIKTLTTDIIPLYWYLQVIFHLGGGRPTNIQAGNATSN